MNEEDAMTAAMPNTVPRMAPNTKLTFVDLDQVQPADRVRISEGRQDVVVWFSTRNFRVSDIKPTTPGAPANPFHRAFPNHDFAPIVCSGAAGKNAVGHTYKVTFTFSNGAILDPEVAVDV
jgi:hypothetical protein